MVETVVLVVVVSRSSAAWSKYITQLAGYSAEIGDARNTQRSDDLG